MTTTLTPHGPAAAFLLTEEQAARLGGAKTPPVTITVGDRTIRGRVARREGLIMVGLSKAAREALGVAPGDTATVTLTLDEAERTVEVPAALADALQEAGLRAAFDAWSFTRRKEAARGVGEAKKDETRDRRIAAVLAELRG